MKTVSLAMTAFIFIVGLVACRNSPTTMSPAERGKSVYAANCTFCHAANPAQVAPVGPAIAGSSRELIEARILHASYPIGYSPQRTTHIMPAMPFLAKDIDALAAYLASQR